MEKNKKYKLELSSLIKIENLLDRVDLGSVKLSTHVRTLVTKLKHQIKLEITNLYLANALYISRLGTVRNSGFSRSVIIREKACQKN